MSGFPTRENWPAPAITTNRISETKCSARDELDDRDTVWWKNKKGLIKLIKKNFSNLYTFKTEVPKTLTCGSADLILHFVAKYFCFLF